MSLAKNTIRFSDITTTPIKLKYSSSFASSSLASYGITTNRGTNTYVSTSGSYTPRILNYKSIRQLYYQNYLTGSVEQSSSFWDPQWQSTAASGSEDFQNSCDSLVPWRFVHERGTQFVFLKESWQEKQK